MQFGSHLYGTNSHNSDLDFKGIYMPDFNNILRNRISKSINLSTNQTHEKNKPDDIDFEIYSLHYFIHLACEGETVALDMLHAPKNMITETSDIWGKIVSNRQKFYTKNLKAFIGYARRQASKYGIKGSRLNDAKRVLDVLNKTGDDRIKLTHIWEELPVGEHIFKHPASEFNNNLRMYEVCGRKIQETASIFYAHSVVENFYKHYGERARQAANNENIDWKAVSHALRAAFQVREILTTKNIIFPLKDAEYLKRVKDGKLDYQKEVAPKLDNLMDEVEELSLNSDLPMKVNKKYWDNFIVEQIRAYYNIYI